MNESIKNNIALGVDENLIDDEKIDFSLSKANIKKFVYSLDNNINTICSDDGINFSGGQKQRIGIARALYRNPEILILDESTSSLDMETEKDLLDDITKFIDKTIIIVSHRLNILKRCNKVLIINPDQTYDFGETTSIIQKHPNLKNYI